MSQTHSYKYSLLTKTYVFLALCFIAILSRFFVLSEPYGGVLSIVIFACITVSGWMLLSGLSSNATEIRKLENQIQEKQLFVANYKETIERMLGEIGNTYDGLEGVLNKQNDEQSRKILAALKEPFAENKRILKELESI